MLRTDVGGRDLNRFGPSSRRRRAASPLGSPDGGDARACAVAVAESECQR